MSLTPSEIEARKGRFTASTFAGLIGRSPYGPPSYWWRVQMGREIPKTNTAMAFGNIFEDAIVAASQYLFRQRNVPGQLAPGAYDRFEKPSTVFHGQHKWLACHPDGVFWDAKEMIQAKRHDPRMAPQYGAPRSNGESDNDIVPLHEVVQCQIEMECWLSHGERKRETGWRVCWLACDFGGADVRLYRITRDASLAESLLARGKRLWPQHMQQGNDAKPLLDADWERWMETRKGRAATEGPPPSRVKLTVDDLLNAPTPTIGAR